jgi:hypothetical protein
VDKNLKESEIADIVVEALTMRWPPSSSSRSRPWPTACATTCSC